VATLSFNHTVLLIQGDEPLLEFLTALAIFLHGENASQIGFGEPLHLRGESREGFAVLLTAGLQLLR
jgi:hypothetical protein